MKQVRADKITIGAAIKNGKAPLYVEDIGDNSLGDIILRCSYEPGTHPGTTLIIRPDEKVEIF